jgi:hypothetical protein
MKTEHPSLGTPGRECPWLRRGATPRADEGVENTKEVGTQPNLPQDSLLTDDVAGGFFCDRFDEAREWKCRSGRTTQNFRRKFWYGFHEPLRFAGSGVGPSRLASRIGIG